jgi:hypothetical protein
MYLKNKIDTIPGKDKNVVEELITKSEKDPAGVNEYIVTNWNTFSPDMKK